MQVNSLQLESSVASKWASKHLWGTIYFAVDCTWKLIIKVCNLNDKIEIALNKLLPSCIRIK